MKNANNQGVYTSSTKISVNETITVSEILKKLHSNMDRLHTEEANNQFQRYVRSIKKRQCQRSLPRSINKISVRLAE